MLDKVISRDPRTRDEWQEAVDSAALFLALDSARQYGLIETDIRVDYKRCEDLLRRGRLQGFVPKSLKELCRMLVKGAA